MSFKQIKKYVVRDKDGVEIAKFTERKHAEDYIELRNRLDVGRGFVIEEKMVEIRSGRV